MSTKNAKEMRKTDAKNAKANKKEAKGTIASKGDSASKPKGKKKTKKA